MAIFMGIYGDIMGDIMGISWDIMGCRKWQ